MDKTPDFADQEAERVVDRFWMKHDEKETTRLIAEALRKAFKEGRDFEHKQDHPRNAKCCDACLETGFEAAREMAAKMAQRHAKECRGIESFEGEGEALHIRDEIRALKPEAEGE